jgi:hypothetical protein
MKNRKQSHDQTNGDKKPGSKSKPGAVSAVLEKEAASSVVTMCALRRPWEWIALNPGPKPEPNPNPKPWLAAQGRNTDQDQDQE